MNADPLMRADLAGLTRPDGCSWNLGTWARARNEQNRGLNRQREIFSTKTTMEKEEKAGILDTNNRRPIVSEST